MTFYILLIIVFNVHPVVVADELNTALFPLTATLNVTPVVVPISVVVVSVKLAVDPLHIDIICPALAPVEPLLINVYSKNAPVYALVGIEYIVFVPPVKLVLVVVFNDGARYEPIKVVLSEKTSSIGNPDISFTLNNEPVKLSDTLNNSPLDP